MKNIRENNRFYKRINRYKINERFIEESFNKFDFNNNLKSDKIDELEFINFLSSDKCNKYFILVDICRKLTQNYNNINKLFIPDEFDSSRCNSQRVYDIINVVNDEEVNRKVVIFKFKCKEDPEIQFYVSKEENILKLRLIDVYHIAIEAVNKKIGKADRKGIYEKRKKCKFNINKITEII